MSKQQEMPNPELEKLPDRQLTNIIGNHTMDALGKPADLQRIQVRRLWGDCYRVNIFVGKDVAATRIANSYFLVADKTGNIVEARPKITKQYRAAIGRSTVPFLTVAACAAGGTNWRTDHAYPRGNREYRGVAASQWC